MMHAYKEEAAIKAKLRRLCEKKKNGALKVPQWLHDEWLQGDHLKMARQLQSCNFDKDPLYLNLLIAKLR